ncbi:hypothetical protein Bwad004_27520 [Bilophila wadsworthia]
MEGGVWGGEEESLLQKGSLSPPQFRILSIPNYGSMKLKGPAWR